MNQEGELASDLIPSLGHAESVRSIYFDARSQGQQSSSLGLSSRVPSLDGSSLADSGIEDNASSVDTEIVADENNEDSLSFGDKIDVSHNETLSAETSCEDQKAAEKAIAALSLGGTEFGTKTCGGGETCQFQTSNVCSPAELISGTVHQQENTNDAQTVLPKIDDPNEDNEKSQDDLSDVRSPLHFKIPSTVNHPQSKNEARVIQNRETKIKDCSTCKQYQSEIDALVGELEYAQRMIQSLVSENGLLGDEIVHLKHCADEERRRMEVDRTQAIATLIAENQMLQIRLDESKQSHREEMRIKSVHEHEEKHTLNGRSEQQVRWKRPPPLGITDGGAMTRDSESQFVGYSPLSAGRLLQS